MPKPFQIIMLIIFIAFGYSRCNTTSYTSEINTVDSLIVVAKQLNQSIINIDSADVISRMVLVNSDFSFVQDSLPSDLFIEASVFLNNIKVVKKMGNSFSSEYKTLKKESQYSIEQLNDLLVDLKGGTLSKKDCDKYIQDESNALFLLNKHYNKIEFGLDVLYNKYSENRDDFYSLYQENQGVK